MPIITDHWINICDILYDEAPEVNIGNSIIFPLLETPDKIGLRLQLMKLTHNRDFTHNRFPRKMTWTEESRVFLVLNLVEN